MSMLENIYEKLINKMVVEELPQIIEIPIQVIKVKKEIVEKLKPPPPDNKFQIELEAQIDMFEDKLNGLTHEMKVAAQKYFPFDIISHPLLTFDDLTMTHEHSI